MTLAAVTVRAETFHVYPGQSIQAAINLAFSYDEIIVHPGRYEETLDMRRMAVTIRSVDPLDWDIVTATIIDGDGDGPIVFCEDLIGPEVRLIGLTITGGDGVQTAGGIEVRGCGCYVSRCRLVGNSSSAGGGAISVSEYNALLTVEDSLFINNEVSDWAATTSHGGAVVLEGSDASFKRCTFIGNTCDGKGGAIYRYKDTLGSARDVTLTGCTFSDNSAEEQGGAIYACSYNGQLTVGDCLFYNNHAPEGGAFAGEGTNSVYSSAFNSNTAQIVGGAILYDGALVLSDTSFTGNVASLGGGLYFSGDATISGCSFEGNVAEGGGGIFMQRLNLIHAMNPSITGCTFLGNAASAWQGGGICNQDANLRLTDCTFIGNTAVQGGGGICNISGAYSMAPVHVNCSFLGNVAEYGGGVFNVSTFPTSCIVASELTNCRFIHNWGLFSAGGVYNQAVAAATLSNCTFTANVGFNHGLYNSVGGMWNYASSVSVDNSIFWADAGHEIVSTDGAVCAVRYSDVQGGYAGAGNLNADPLFVNAIGPDGTWGTADDNVRLAQGSPCIDAADSSALPEDALDLDEDGDTDEPIPVDLDRYLRRADDPDTDDTGVGFPCIDMGAYEVSQRGDCNGDGCVDLLDFAAYCACLTGPGKPASIFCRIFDFEGDGDVDLQDFGSFQIAFDAE